MDTKLNKMTAVFTNPDYESYRIAIENLANTQDGKIFENSGNIHAAIVLGNIFRQAREYVKLYTGALHSDISNEPYYLKYLKQYLNKKGKLEIVFENEPDENSKAFSLIVQEMNDPRANITLKKLTQSVISENSKFNHFAIADDMMFRVEEKNGYTAFCSFNNKETVEVLSNWFSEICKIAHTFIQRQ